ncbi:MAG: HD domain-containing protein, partial [Thiobacillaceae bacterium]
MSETLRPIAHAAQNPDGSWRDPHDLAEHLAGVAALSACHARNFGAEDWAHLAGLWHDLGKYRLIDPGSEWRLHRHWFDANAMGDLLGAGFELAEKNTLYRCL